MTGTVNGQSQDLTAAVTYSATPAGVVTIDGNGLATATGTAGGRVIVTAASGATSAAATLTVSDSASSADPGPAGSGVPANVQSIFSAAPADPSRAPQLVYPNDGVLFPQGPCFGHVASVDRRDRARDEGTYTLTLRVRPRPLRPVR